MTLRQMLAYLEKFNKLPPELREKVSSPEAMEIIDVLEKKYGVSLATVVMKVMVKEISVGDLAKYFVFENELDSHRADQLVKDLLEKIFYNFADYLEISKIKKKDDEVLANIPSDTVPVKVIKKEPANPGFFFSSEDEEEVKELNKKFEGFSQNQDLPKQNEDKINTKIDLIRKQIGINFSSDDLNNRFTQVIRTYLKGVRNKIDTRQTLKKSVDTGGLGMDDIFSDNVLSVTDKINSADTISANLIAKNDFKTDQQGEEIDKSTKPTEKNLERDNKLSVDSLKDSGIRDIDYDFSKLSKSNIAQSGISSADLPKPVENEKPTLSPENIKLSDVAKKINEVKISPMSGSKSGSDTEHNNISKNNELSDAEEKREVPSMEKKPTVNMVNVRRSIIADGKKRMDDVKYVPKLMGPIEELGDMSLINFRRLNQNPAIAVNKIKEKLGFLEEEGFDKKLAGIKAWRQSPVNSLYLTIAQESINNKTSIDEIISQRTNTEKDSLTNDEIEAIMELNKSLRF